jgi:hypothetical protein
VGFRHNEPKLITAMKTIFDSARWAFAAVVPLAALVLLQAMPAAADDSDSLYSNLSGTSQTQLNIVVNGNHTTDFKSTANPFGAGGSVSYNYDSVKNTTTISFSGPNAIAPSAQAYAGLETSGFSDQVAYAYWGPPQGTVPSSNLRLPAPSFFVSNPGAGPNTGFVILYSTIELGNGSLANEWSELPVPANQPFKVGIGNNDNLDGPLFAFDAKFFLSTTEIPLDDLNSVYEPPTGSQFQPLPGIPDDSPIKPGSSLESLPLIAPPGPAVPEPSTWLAGVLLLAFCVGGAWQKVRTA